MIGEACCELDATELQLAADTGAMDDTDAEGIVGRLVWTNAGLVRRTEMLFIVACVFMFDFGCFEGALVVDSLEAWLAIATPQDKRLGRRIQERIAQL